MLPDLPTAPKDYIWGWLPRDLTCAQAQDTRLQAALNQGWQLVTYQEMKFIDSVLATEYCSTTELIPVIQVQDVVLGKILSQTLDQQFEVIPEEDYSYDV